MIYCNTFLTQNCQYITSKQKLHHRIFTESWS